MKDLFPGHFTESEQNLKTIWSTCQFAFDANILLNLYRYSDTTRKEFLRIMIKLQSRICLPYRAAEEYLSNRLSVIGQQEKSYDETVKSINRLKDVLHNARQHPFVSTKTMAQADKIFQALCKELDRNKEIHTKRISNDEIKESIAALFLNRVGPPYDKEKLEEIIGEGEERYRQQIPPGFKDESKYGESDIFAERCRKFGDLFVWCQVIDISIKSGQGVILVTDDKKEDWWESFNGKTVGARPELVKEFKDKTNNTFHMYRADRFIELARLYLDEHVSDEIVDEIREVRLRDLKANRKSKQIEYDNKRIVKMDHLVRSIQKVRNKISIIDQERQISKERVNYTERQANELLTYRDTLLNVNSPDIEIEPLMEHYSRLKAQQKQAERELELTSNRRIEMRHKLSDLERRIAHYTTLIEQESSIDSQTSMHIETLNNLHHTTDF